MTEWAAIHLKEKPSVYQGHECFIFSLERTRPCRMLNNFHVCSCLPRLIMELSPSTVEPTPSNYLTCVRARLPVVILSENGSMQMYPARISTNKQTNAEGKKQSKEQSGLKGKQMPNIAFHKPKKHARKSKMYSCKT